jgi:hypothetical protein
MGRELDGADRSPSATARDDVNTFHHSPMRATNGGMSLWKALLNSLGFTERPSDYPTCPTCSRPADVYQTTCSNPIHLHKTV